MFDCIWKCVRARFFSQNRITTKPRTVRRNAAWEAQSGPVRAGGSHTKPSTLHSSISQPQGACTVAWCASSTILQRSRPLATSTTRAPSGVRSRIVAPASDGRQSPVASNFNCPTLGWTRCLISINNKSRAGRSGFISRIPRSIRATIPCRCPRTTSSSRGK